VRTLLRLVFVLAAVWIGGFLWFWTRLPPNELMVSPATKTDGIVVLTGGEGRVAHGLKILRAGKARRLLISGAFSQTKPAEIAAATKMPLRLFTCCVDIGYGAGNTIGNAGEAAAWVTKNRYQSVRIVTSRYHVPRSVMEFQAGLPSTQIVIDAVPDTASKMELVREYNKFLVRLVWLRVVKPVMALMP
jgi:uncharacterized SAM-binding protein YcdF (DUF218 family)